MTVPLRTRAEVAGPQSPARPKLSPAARGLYRFPNDVFQTPGLFWIVVCTHQVGAQALRICNVL